MSSEYIQYSRHARRRMKLYNLSEEDVSSIIMHHDLDHSLSEGKYEVISEAKLSQHGYPIKVIYACENEQIVVITAYPLRKGNKP